IFPEFLARWATSEPLSASNKVNEDRRPRGIRRGFAAVSAMRSEGRSQRPSALVFELPDRERDAGGSNDFAHLQQSAGDRGSRQRWAVPRRDRPDAAPRRRHGGGARQDDRGGPVRRASTC